MIPVLWRQRQRDFTKAPWTVGIGKLVSSKFNVSKNNVDRY